MVREMKVTLEGTWASLNLMYVGETLWSSDNQAAVVMFASLYSFTQLFSTLKEA